jgi:hypothetical protein
MEFIGLTLLVQIALIVHVLRTGRPIYWVFLIMFLPAVGSIAYFFVELLPELSGNRRAKSAMRSVRKTLDPGADLRHHERQHRLSGSVDAARRLADELYDAGRFDEAIEHYQKSLSGLYECDPDLMLGLAEAQFGKQDYRSARQTLDDLMLHNPDFKSPHGHLLYARATEELGELDKAVQEYKAVAAYYAGAEAEIRYAALLEQLDRDDEALTIYIDVVDSAELAPKHYQKAQKEWIGQARDGVKRLAN